MAYYNNLSTVFQASDKRRRGSRRVADSGNDGLSVAGATFQDVVSEVHAQGLQAFFDESDELTGELSLSSVEGNREADAYRIHLVFGNDGKSAPESVDADLVSGVAVPVGSVHLELYPQIDNSAAYCVWYRDTKFMDDITKDDISVFIKAFGEVVQDQPASYIDAYKLLLSSLKRHSAYYAHGLSKKMLGEVESLRNGVPSQSGRVNVQSDSRASKHPRASRLSNQVKDSDIPHFKFTMSALAEALEAIGGYFVFTRKGSSGEDLLITFYHSIHLDSEGERACHCHPRLATVVSTSQQFTDEVYSFQFQLLSKSGSSKDVLMENTPTTAQEAGRVLSLSHITEAIRSFVLHNYATIEEVKAAFTDTFVGGRADSGLVAAVSDSDDSDSVIAEGAIVYAHSPKLETLQGEPLTVVSVNKSLDAAVVKDKTGKCMAVRLSYLKRE